MRSTGLGLKSNNPNLKGGEKSKRKELKIRKKLNFARGWPRGRSRQPQRFPGSKKIKKSTKISTPSNNIIYKIHCFVINEHLDYERILELD